MAVASCYAGTMFFLWRKSTEDGIWRLYLGPSLRFYGPVRLALYAWFAKYMKFEWMKQDFGIPNHEEEDVEHWPKLGQVDYNEDPGLCPA